MKTSHTVYLLFRFIRGVENNKVKNKIVKIQKSWSSTKTEVINQ